MEEQFILRVPPSVAERIDRLLSENESSEEDKSLDLSFCEDGRSGTFVIGNDHFPVSLMDLPCVVESFKTYDDCALVKTADIGQMIMVREPGDSTPDAVEYRHGLTPPMRDALNEQEEEGDGNARHANRKDAPSPQLKQPDIAEAGANTGAPARSDSDESDDSM
ncbi:transcription initiation factor TFIID subunit 7 [Citrus sinensis]|uniref:Transcription initiation factor TFIID subunit 7 n=1 Tax=Citrus sinensis TaxID=2711 RepID=A0ACB8MUY8_CITSI|nr:transcription initiation factor TFIID subunit 7 [Citrus sinensis]KAH9789154.1 transcription initiation factor TFIID subunit 7 [Citrus sinensis]